MKYIELLENEFDDELVPTSTNEGFIQLKKQFDSLLYVKKKLENRFNDLALKTAAPSVKDLNAQEITKLRTKRNNIIQRIQNFPEYALNQPGGKVQIKGRKGFINPYFLGSIGNYAGPIESSNILQSTDFMNIINRALKKHHINPLSIVYYSKTDNGKVNFAMIGANGRFVWRQYNKDNTAMQSIYIDNKKYTESYFINLKDHQYDHILAPLKSSV